MDLFNVSKAAEQINAIISPINKKDECPNILFLLKNVYYKYAKSYLIDSKTCLRFFIVLLLLHNYEDNSYYLLVT